MFVHLDYTDGSWYVLRPRNGRCCEYCVYLSPQLLAAWEAWSQQGAVFDSLFTSLKNQQLEENKRLEEKEE